MSLTCTYTNCICFDNPVLSSFRLNNAFVKRKYFNHFTNAIKVKVNHVFVFKLFQTVPRVQSTFLTFSRSSCGPDITMKQPGTVLNTWFNN